MVRNHPIKINTDYVTIMLKISHTLYVVPIKYGFVITTIKTWCHSKDSL